MITKKLRRVVKCKWWDKKYKIYHNVTYTCYLGYYLFGFIPLYQTVISKEEELNYPDVYEDKATDKPYVYTPCVYEKYGYLLTKRG
jgi:hypothetical protein